MMPLRVEQQDRPIARRRPPPPPARRKKAPKRRRRTARRRGIGFFTKLSTVTKWVISLVAWLCVLFAGIYVWSVQGENGGAARDQGRLAQIPDDRFVIGRLNNYRAFVERPLFVSTRRPPVQAQATGPSPEAALNQFEFQGTAMLDTGQLAFFWDTKRRLMLRMKRGDTLAGWRVQQIQSQRVVLNQADQSVTLTFDQ